MLNSTLSFGAFKIFYHKKFQSTRKLKQFVKSSREVLKILAKSYKYFFFYMNYKSQSLII